MIHLERKILENFPAICFAILDLIYARADQRRPFDFRRLNVGLEPARSRDSHAAWRGE
jgi:hypothetical protein